MTGRVCPECGCDTWKAAGYDELLAARHRWQKTAERQARDILLLEEEVGRLKELEQLRSRKVRRQARVIRRLENRLREVGLWPHEGAKLGDIAPVDQSLPPDTPLEHDPFLNTGALRARRRRLRRQRGEDPESDVKG